jgi:hypothetical protein
MRIFGAFVVAGILVVSMGCGSSSNDNKSSGGRSPASGGMCPASSSGQTCTGEQAYLDCLQAACGTQYKDCFGNDYMSGVFGGKCGDYLTCLMACPCDATASSCESNCTNLVLTNAACQTCLLTMGLCTQGAGCQQPCQGTGIDAGPAAGANCTALAACCSSLDASLAPTCQTALAAAGGVETTCSTILGGFKSANLCL